MSDAAKDAYTAIGQASLQVRRARELCDRLTARLDEPADILAVEGITHELTDAALLLQDAVGKVRSIVRSEAA